MVCRTVTSAANPIIKRYAALQRAAARAETGAFLAEGASLVRECVNERIKIETIFVREDAAEKHAALLSAADCEVILTSAAALEKLSSMKTAPDIAAVCRIPEYRKSLRAEGRYIVCADVQDPANIGAVIRSAAAFGVDGVILCGGCDPFSPKVLRGSMGAVFKISLHAFDSFEQAAQQLRALDIPLYAAMLDRDARSVTEVDFSRGGAVAVGNEGAGLSSAQAALCGGRVYIPIAPQVESLNAAVAASIVMWEMSGRGRREKDKQ